MKTLKTSWRQIVGVCRLLQKEIWNMLWTGQVSPTHLAKQQIQRFTSENLLWTIAHLFFFCLLTSLRDSDRTERELTCGEWWSSLDLNRLQPDSTSSTEPCDAQPTQPQGLSHRGILNILVTPRHLFFGLSTLLKVGTWRMGKREGMTQKITPQARIEPQVGCGARINKG